MAIVKANYIFFKHLLASRAETIQWRRVRNLICVHTFIDNYYINLCHFIDANGSNAMSLSVDDMENKISDLVDSAFTPESGEYHYLHAMYCKALETCTQVSLVHTA